MDKIVLQSKEGTMLKFLQVPNYLIFKLLFLKCFLIKTCTMEIPSYSEIIYCQKYN